MDRLVDWTTKLWKIVDHNPGVALALVLSAVLVGCDSSWLAGKVDSMITGERSTGTQIRAVAQTTIQRFEDERQQLITRIEQVRGELQNLVLVAGRELEGIDSKIDTTISAANDELEQADAATERRSGWVKGLLTFTGSAIPGFGPVVPLLLAGGLGADNMRTKRVVKRLKNGGDK